MAGYPLVGTTATLTSVGGSQDLAQLLVTALKINEITINEDADEFDITELDASSTSYGTERMQGLASGTFDFVGHFPKSSPRLGNGGLVTYDGTARAFVSGWTLRAEFGEIDITCFDTTEAAIPTARTYMPNGVFDWSGTFSAIALENAAALQPVAANGSAVTAVFKLAEDGASDPRLEGSVRIKSVRQSLRKAEKQALEYSWSGTGLLKEYKGSTLPGLRVSATGNWEPPKWDTSGTDGVPDVTVVITTATDRTITAAAFLRSLEISCEVGQPIRVSGTVRYCGSIARA